MNQGRTVFAQLIDLLPRRAFELAVQRHRIRGRQLLLSCMDQLLCMIFAQVTSRASLRETVTCLRAIGSRCYHLGIGHRPARSTLADANELRDHRIFADTAMSMIAQLGAELPIDPDLRRLCGAPRPPYLEGTTAIPRIDRDIARRPYAAEVMRLAAEG